MPPLHGVVDVETCFVVRTHDRALLFAAVADPTNVKKRSAMEKSRALRPAWIGKFLEARDAAARAKRRRPEAAPRDNETLKLNPRVWEDLVARADVARDRRKGHPNVIRSLWALAQSQKQDVALRGLRALLNVCLDPTVNRHVRERYAADVAKLPRSLAAILLLADDDDDRESADESTPGEKPCVALAVMKLELLAVLGQIGAVEESTCVVPRRLREKFKKAVIHWRRHLGYKALAFIKDDFDGPTLRRLEETFAEIDEDGSGQISHDELGHFFADTLKTPLSKKQLRDIVDEVDVDGNGEVDFEEFLLVVKNLKTMRHVQSKLGVALAKKSIADFGQDVAFAATSKRKKKERMKRDLEETRVRRAEEDELAMEDQLRRRRVASREYAVERKKRANAWHVAARELYAEIQAEPDTLAAAFEVLVSRRSDLVPKLGFFYDFEPFDLAYDDLEACAEEAGLKLPVRPGPPSSSSSSEREDDDAEEDISRQLSYPVFESQLYRVIAQFRKAEEEDDEDGSSL